MYGILVGLRGDQAIGDEAYLGGDGESARGKDWLGIHGGGLE